MDASHHQGMLYILKEMKASPNLNTWSVLQSPLENELHFFTCITMNNTK